MTRSKIRLIPALTALALLAGGGILWAENDFPVGSIIRGFDLPSRDPKTGKLVFRVTGDKAIVMSPNRFEIHKLKIEVYSDDKINATITCPVSDFWRLENRLTSSTGVDITLPGLTASSKQMEWDLPKSKGVLRGNVVVVIQDLQNKK